MTDPEKIFLMIHATMIPAKIKIYVDDSGVILNTNAGLMRCTKLLGFAPRRSRQVAVYFRDIKNGDVLEIIRDRKLVPVLIGADGVPHFFHFSSYTIAMGPDFEPAFKVCTITPKKAQTADKKASKSNAKTPKTKTPKGPKK